MSEKYDSAQQGSRFTPRFPFRILSLGLFVSIGALSTAACDDDADSGDTRSSTHSQTLAEYDFDDGALPPGFVASPVDCVTIRQDASGGCEEPAFDPDADYQGGEVVSAAAKLWECKSDNSSACATTPPDGPAVYDAWNSLGDCTPSGFGAELEDTCEVIIDEGFSTQGFSAIKVSYLYRNTAYDWYPLDQYVAEWSVDGGVAWTQAGAAFGPNVDWTQVDVVLPEGALDKGDLRVRLRTTADGQTNGQPAPNTEASHIDTIKIVGEAPVGCLPSDVCDAADRHCGTYDDPSCGLVTCGNCSGIDELCNEETNQCELECDPTIVCADSCGTVDTGAACGVVQCPTCSGDDICVSGTCFDGCSPEAVCANAGAACGTLDVPACTPSEFDCGGCGTGSSCVDNTCTDCLGATCEELGATCGTVDDGCGGLDCGLCAQGQVCSDDWVCIPDPCPDCGILTLDDVDTLNEFRDCQQLCSYGRAATQDECLAQCGVWEERWDKNRDGVIDDLDALLALAEINSPDQVCVENGVALPLLACGLADCESREDLSAADCADEDGDGLLAFQEQLAGTDDLPGSDSWDAPCDDATPCESFAQECRVVKDDADNLALPFKVCQRRIPYCSTADASAFGGECTAFHLEEVSQDADQVILRVFYDYSPRPANVLDLRISYDDGTLLLADARQVGGMVAAGKELDARHVGSGDLRLTVLGEGSSAPIPTGPIAELVFVRMSSSATTVGFSDSTYDRTWSIAPDQGEASVELAHQNLWGTADFEDAPGGTHLRYIDVEQAGSNADRLLLHYSFDNPVSPLEPTDRIPTGEELCQMSPAPGVTQGYGCFPSGVTDSSQIEERARTVARFDAMQRGVVQSGGVIDGVSGPGVFLDGISNHLQLPVTLSTVNNDVVPDDQSFTVSLWFYGEGDGTPGQRQVLWSHNNPSSEGIQYAVLLNPKSDGTFDLEWLEGGSLPTDPDVSAPAVRFANGLTSLHWYNLAVAFDAVQNQVGFYVDGTPADTAAVDVQNDPSCPQRRTPNTGILVPEEGAGTNARTPEQIYFTSSENSLYGIERIEPNGFSRHEILRTGVSSAKDVHYQQQLDRIVFTSTESGDLEVWMANGDGSNARQVTFGFADTERGIFARRPRWVPGGSGVVFESNVYSAGDNAGHRAYRLFYLAYDPIANEFAIPTEAAAAPKTSLAYSDAVPELYQYRLTSSEFNSSNAHVVRGPRTVDGALVDRGEIWFTESAPDWSGAHVAKMLIGAENPATSSCSTDLGAENPTDYGSCGVPSEEEVRLISAASYSSELGDETHVRLAERRFAHYSGSDRVAIDVDDDGSDTLVTVTYLGSGGFPCWDADGSEVECAAEALDGLLLTFPTALEPEQSAEGVIVDLTDEDTDGNTPLARLEKALKLEPTGANINGTPVSGIRMHVVSKYNVDPIPADTVLGTFRLIGVDDGSTPIQVREEFLEQELLLQRDHFPAAGGGSSTLESLTLPGIERVLAAGFDRKVERFVLAGLEEARPIVATTTVAAPAEGRELLKLLPEPVAVETLQWVEVDRAFPCNWVGTHRDPQSKGYIAGFRGGLDELKLYSYARSSSVIASESARGHERLQRDLALGETEPPASASPPCDSHSDCGDFKLCVGGSCQVQDCSDTGTCAVGKCVLMAATGVPGGQAQGSYACDVECSSDQQCFSQECLNGPCRFCDGGACRECRTVVRTIGSDITVREVEGCPDRNAYECVEGSCVTECYSFENGASQYLCREGIEFCDRGRCRLIDWDWTDLAPATFSGLNDMLFSSTGMDDRTIAISQLNYIDIVAVGAPDYGMAPRLLVEGRVEFIGDSGGFGNTVLFDGDWFDVGEIVVYAEAGNPGRYTLTTPYPLTDIRVSLVKPPFWNPNLGGTGRDGAYGPFCAEYGDQECTAGRTGSRDRLQYDVGMAPSGYFCPGRNDCANYDEPTAEGNYLLPGNQTAVVRSVELNGNGIQPSAHWMCGYDSSPVPVDQATGQRRPLLPPSSGLVSAFDDPLVPWVLNCAYDDPSSSEHAALVFTGIPATTYVHPSDAPLQSGRMQENTLGCTVRRDQPPDELCFEWEGDASMDVMVQELQLYQTLELQEFTSFGYDAPEGQPYQPAP